MVLMFFLYQTCYLMPPPTLQLWELKPDEKTHLIHYSALSIAWHQLWDDEECVPTTHLLCNRGGLLKVTKLAIRKRDRGQIEAGSYEIPLLACFRFPSRQLSWDNRQELAEIFIPTMAVL
jgi:hypothetical protein